MFIRKNNEFIFASLLIILCIGCENKIVDTKPEPLQVFEGVSVIDSNFTLRAIYAPEAFKPDLSIKAKIKLHVAAKFVKNVSFTIIITNIAKSYSSEMKLSRTDSTISIEIEDIFTGIEPFVFKPLVTTKIELYCVINNVDSTCMVEFKSKPEVLWNGLSEPDLKRIKCYASNYRPSGPLVWEPNGNGLYFHGTYGIYSQLLYYSLLDQSTHALTASTSDYKICDISHDGEVLLVVDARAEPENIYLFDISTKKMEVLLPARENYRVTSARFSFNDSLIAFVAETHPSPGMHSIWLYCRNDSTLIELKSISVNDPKITSWYPESNDSFVLHDYGRSLYIYSIGDTSLSKYYFDTPFYPRYIVRGGSHVLGMQINEIVSSTVTESHVWIYSIHGDPISQLTFYPEVIFSYSLSSDNAKLAVTGHRDEEFGLWLLLVDKIISNLGIDVITVE